VLIAGASSCASRVDRGPSFLSIVIEAPRCDCFLALFRSSLQNIELSSMLLHRTFLFGASSSSELLLLSALLSSGIECSEEIYSTDERNGRYFFFSPTAMDVDWLRALRRFKRFCIKHKFCISYIVGLSQSCVMKLSSNYKHTVFFLLLEHFCLSVGVWFFFCLFLGSESTLMAAVIKKNRHYAYYFKI